MGTPSTQLFTADELADLDYTNNLRKDIANELLANGVDKASEEEITIALKALKDIDSNRFTRAKVRIAKDIQENTGNEATVMAAAMVEILRNKLGRNDVILPREALPEIPSQLQLGKDDFVEGEISTGYTEISPDEILEEEH